MPAIPEFVWQRFGNERAQPVVVEVYSDPQVGWVRAPRRVKLTALEMARLRADGVTIVRARWRMHMEQIPTSQADGVEVVRRRRSTFIAEERRGGGRRGEAKTAAAPPSHDGNQEFTGSNETLMSENQGHPRLRTASE